MRVTTLAAIGITTLIGCTPDVSEPEALTYDEFKARAYLEPETGLYIINGDEVIETEEAMLASYDSFLQSLSDAKLREEGLATVSQGLIINRVSGRDDKWSAATAANLTYCISRSSFGTRYNTVVSAMANAASAWESATGGAVNFVHVSSADSNCTTSTNVVFNVRQRQTTQYLASAFFPSYARSSRQVIIASSSFGNISPWTLTGVLRHELGHTLGFRHEHTRPEGANDCFEDNSWRALTAYDSASVMHYPQCDGTQNGDLVLTSADRSGANSVY
ncbi:MAG TPA: M57 family metalloprotease [Kofleriaceae bacterium]|nr:M57 family metalloprotease [Kofleriaceae bacterium]